MFLTKEEKDMATGKYGPGMQKSIKYLIKYGEALGAKKMIEISSGHTMPKEPLELLEDMTEGVENVNVYSTLHPVMSAFDPNNWEKMGIPESFGFNELDLYRKRKEIYQRLGILETYTCLPMLVGNIPNKGDKISWIGSGAQLLSNSLCGARCNRDGTVINLASAITGRAPLHGLFLDENRFAEIIVQFKGLDFSKLSHTELGAIGYYVGAKAQNHNVAMDGISEHLDIDQLKYLMAPLSVSGAVSICHIVGFTPEAPDLETALGDSKAKEIITITKKEIEKSLFQYYWDNEEVDLVVLGCPHLTIDEIKLMAKLLKDKKLRNNKRLWAGMSYQHYTLAQEMGLSQIIEKAGGIFARSCMATIPDAPIPENVKVIATNSFKAAHYISRFSKGRVKVMIGEIDRCLEAVNENQ